MRPACLGRGERAAVRSTGKRSVAGCVLIAAVAIAPPAAVADGEQCRVLDVELQVATSPSRFAPQIVGWIEDAAGTFVDTIFITHQTGTFGLGNRPGRFDFNSAPFWPYGRRITTFPVWAHRHGLSWPELRFQDNDDNDLSHAGSQSSIDNHYCRPLKPSEFDAVSCPSVRSFTDKGVMAQNASSRYPPRGDLNLLPQDHPSVEMFAMLNPFDAVSRPTPRAGERSTITWAVPPELPAGAYVLLLEVSKEFDMNGTYNETAYPSPGGIPWADYGSPYRGQPSVIYRVPFTIDDDETVAITDRYAGYGDPDGLDGNLRAPDDTISDLPGSGAGRLALVSDAGQTFRVRVTASQELDDEPPVAPRDANITALTANRATIAFTAPGDDGLVGRVTSYEVRYRVREPITEATFATATLVPVAIPPVDPGGEQTFTLEGLLPETTYWVAIRAYDNCRNASPLTIVEITTPERPIGEVDACFVATAAYGSMLAGEVELLRRFRDSLLAKTALGELAIEAYYTFGPALSGIVGESDMLRATAREALAPIVDQIKQLRW
jgi:hypothetical protein